MPILQKHFLQTMRILLANLLHHFKDCKAMLKTLGITQVVVQLIILCLTTKKLKIAKGADHVVLVMGLDQTQEKEDHDRVDLVLPPKQQNLISSVAKAAKNSIILVRLFENPIDITFIKYDQHIESDIRGLY